MKTMPSRISLAHLPTPIQKLERFSARLGINIYIKRDDLTGMECSGNKIRKLEFAVREALDQGADTLITCGGLQSNHCRATAAVAARLGLRSCLVLRSADPSPKADGNLLIDRMLGADIRFIDADAYRNRRSAIMESLAREYEAKGHRAYIIPEGASNGIGTFGYLTCMEEIAEQERQMGLTFDTIVDAVGSGGTFAGLFLANRLLHLEKRVVGINICDDAAFFRTRILEILEEAQEYLETKVVIAPEEIEILDGYVGEGYALSRPEELEFIRDFARLEGIVLDPVYTGKCLYGLQQEAEKGSFSGCKNLLFLHTGGLFGLFPIRDQIPFPQL